MIYVYGLFMCAVTIMAISGYRLFAKSGNSPFALF